MRLQRSIGFSRVTQISFLNLRIFHEASHRLRLVAETEKLTTK
ncbi:hypothetical protein CEV32_1399 [Brucella rhizosphaerae]|uniref:Uncharacterized protein n=1 Tax=Brucella rhizosphaerae TaxID=571254 RepID=A0A256FAA9_9HYPH|nr:hypothetical protein CEV32_1399 [Brucella rhizosphaerae]